MANLQSEIVVNESQGNGMIFVVEKHLDVDTGKEIRCSYEATEDFDVNAVLAMRSEAIGKELDRKKLEVQEALNFSIPLSKDEFRNLYTAEEQAAVAYFYATYLQREDLSLEEKKTITAGIDYYKDVKNVHLNHPLTISAVSMHEGLGLIAQGRANEILGIS